MVIGIDIRVLGSSQKSGIEEYTENLLANLIPLDKSITYKLFYSSWKNKLPEYSWLNLENVELIIKKIPNKILFMSSRVLARPYLDELVGGADIFFSPHFFIAPLSPECKRVTTFHDLSFIRFPEFFSWKKLLWHKLEMNPKGQALLSDAIITVSESTKKDLENLFDVDPKKIHVIYSGISNNIDIPHPKDLEQFRKLKNLPRNFILTLGKVEPRKNMVSLIAAFNNLKRGNKYKDLYLVIAGANGWLYNDVYREINRSDYRNFILTMGQVNDNERSYYYSLSRCFIYPSYFEGFGLPNLEAIKCKIPVITSNNSSIPEVVRGSALTVSPYSINEIQRAIEFVIGNTKLSSGFVIKGNNLINNYSWSNSSAQTLKIIKSIY